MNPKKIIQPVSLSKSDVPSSAPPQPSGSQSVQSAEPHPRVDVSKVYANIESTPQPATKKVSPERPKRGFRLGMARNIIVILLFILAGVTFFTRNEYRHITQIDPAALNAPLQTETIAAEFTHEHKDVEYFVKPLFDYELNGMVVSRLDYEKSRTADQYADDTLFPADLCMIWGENLASGVYRSDSTTFSQGGRWCTWQWGEGKGVVNEGVANNHLMFTDPAVKAKLKGIQAGDQIRIVGKLVNVHTITTGTSPEKVVSRNSSTVRTDTGGTSCEDILVEDIIILRKNRNISQTLFIGSLIAATILIGLSVLIWLVRTIKT